MKNLFTILLLLVCLSSNAQSADSTLVNQLRKEGITFSNNNFLVLLKGGQEKFDDLFEAIKQAKSSIHLEYFNFRNDSISSLLFNLLEVKANEGVEVRALFDAFGNISNNRPLNNRHLDSLRVRGIEIYKFDPIKFPWVNHVFSRDHRKIVVIDGRIAYTGGINVADYYITGTRKLGTWNDLHCRIDGDAVNTLQRIFIKMWNKVTGQNIYGAKYYRGCMDSANYFKNLKPDTTFTKGTKMIGIINREPRISNKIIRQFYINAINDAQDSIQVINPYFTLNRKLKNAFKNAAKRGVKVDIMLSIHNDIPLTPDCGFYNAHYLMKKGCNIWMYIPGFHHTKIILVDGKVCTIGSANLNARSLSWDYEANAVIIDKQTTKELNNLFDNDKKDCFQLTNEAWDKWRSPWQKFRGWFAHLLAPFL